MAQPLFSSLKHSAENSWASPTGPFFLSILVFSLLVASSLSVTTPAARAQSEKAVAPDCTWHGKKLYGKIKLVESFPDLKVQVVTSFPDLKVQTVTSFPTECGKWQFVEHFPDLKVQIVDSFPDVKIQYVTSFPGITP